MVPELRGENGLRGVRMSEDKWISIHDMLPDDNDEVLDLKSRYLQFQRK